ncbi:hypothetical protein BpHYR1_042838 [Brachionus plicatilis]|uniref:Uncharacterized protein n=1 Tax=Brachionus plicatilis TaxID=10195 RepID=A0A3M7RRR7_BRAPC|nr:hypothetical protein BpHYR1_042838 [Brachionus plicatilis]
MGIFIISSKRNESSSAFANIINTHKNLSIYNCFSRSFKKLEQGYANHLQACCIISNNFFFTFGGLLKIIPKFRDFEIILWFLTVLSLTVNFVISMQMEHYTMLSCFIAGLCFSIKNPLSLKKSKWTIPNWYWILSYES